MYIEKIQISQSISTNVYFLYHNHIREDSCIMVTTNIYHMIWCNAKLLMYVYMSKYGMWYHFIWYGCNKTYLWIYRSTECHIIWYDITQYNSCMDIFKYRIENQMSEINLCFSRSNLLQQCACFHYTLCSIYMHTLYMK
jgi:hypothetical protein